MIHLISEILQNIPKLSLTIISKGQYFNSLYCLDVSINIYRMGAIYYAYFYKIL